MSDWRAITTIEPDAEVEVSCHGCDWRGCLSALHPDTIHRCACGDRYRLIELDNDFLLEGLPFDDSEEKIVREFADADVRVFRGRVRQWQQDDRVTGLIPADVVGRWRGTPVRVKCWLPACEELIDGLLDRGRPTRVWVVFRPFWSSTTPDDLGVWDVDAKETIAVHADPMEGGDE